MVRQLQFHAPIKRLDFSYNCTYFSIHFAPNKRFHEPIIRQKFTLKCIETKNYLNNAPIMRRSQLSDAPIIRLLLYLQTNLEVFARDNR